MEGAIEEASVGTIHGWLWYLDASQFACKKAFSSVLFKVPTDVASYFSHEFFCVSPDKKKEKDDNKRCCNKYNFNCFFNKIAQLIAINNLNC